jgi:hypothetical protein
MTEAFNPQAAFATGLLLHEGTGRPVDGQIEISADEGPVIGKVFADGRFVVSSYARFANQVHLHVHASSAQYRAGFTDFPVVVPIPPGADFDPDPPVVPTPLVDLGTILLPADSVNLRGRVMNAADPELPIAGATVEVLHSGPNPISPALTDSDGYYRFDEIVVKAPATIKCSTVSHTETRRLLLDYGKLINEEHFRLLPP